MTSQDAVRMIVDNLDTLNTLGLVAVFCGLVAYVILGAQRLGWGFPRGFLPLRGKWLIYAAVGVLVMGYVLVSIVLSLTLGELSPDLELGIGFAFGFLTYCFLAVVAAAVLLVVFVLCKLLERIT